MYNFIKKHKLIVVLLTPIYIMVIYLSFNKTDMGIITPGGITKMSDKVVILNDYETSGDLNTVYVHSIKKPSTIFLEFAKLFKYNDIYSLSENENLLSNKELDEVSAISYKTGLVNSIISAYRESNQEITYHLDGVYVYYLYKNMAKTNLEIGDKIVLVNGESFLSLEDFNNIIENSLNEDVLQLTLEDGTIKKAYSNNGKYYFTITANYQIDNSDIPYEIIKATGSGNSGGLLQALSMYISLTEEDITKGRKIAGTGAISIDGEALEIGGIKQKVVSASNNNCDIFICPSVHYEEALEMQEYINSDMKIVGVDNLKAAITYLRNN